MKSINNVKKRGRRIILLSFVQVSMIILLCGCGKDKDGKSGLKPRPEKSRAIYIYMCGSNLESRNGNGGKDIDELLSADVGDDMYIIIETGGSKEWKSHDIANDAISRYEISGGELKLIEKADNANMGEPQTLTDFITWGKEYFPAGEAMLILWDHGYGPVGGVCLDENYGFDSLSINELSDALKNAGLEKKLNIIGFDACLMASLETAISVGDYADYMIASEETEPTGGWDYKALAEAYSEGRSSLETCKSNCDSYMDKCREEGKDSYVELSVFDLSYLDQMVDQFEIAVDIVQGELRSSDRASEMIHALRNCERFGGSNSYKGASNLLDFLDLFLNLPELRRDITEFWDVVYKLIPYKVKGDNRNATGLSFYYPVLYDKGEIEEYISYGIVGKYNDFLRDYYFNTPDKTVELTDTGSVGEDGEYMISLTPDSSYYLSSVEYILMTEDTNGEQHILYSDNDIIRDTDKMTFRSRIRESCLSLDGHRMFSTTTARNEYYTDYTSDVIVNGKRMSLIYGYEPPLDYEAEDEGDYFIFGLWEGYDENGFPAGDLVQLKKGDIVQVITDITYEYGSVVEHWSEEFTIGDEGGIISEIPIEEKSLKYIFIVKDVFGNAFTSDTATFEEGVVKSIEAYTLGYVTED